MAITIASHRVQPLPEPQRFRIAVAVSLAVHLGLLLLISRSAGRAPAAPKTPEPIEVSFTAAPVSPEPEPRLLPEPVALPAAPPRPEPKPRLKPKPQPERKRPVKVEARPIAHARSAHSRGGGNPEAPLVSNPSPITSRRPSSRPASNAGGRAKAAPAPPHLLTVKGGPTPAGPVGRGSAPSGPGGQAEVPGGGPTYGPGVVGGPAPIYPKAAQDLGWEGKVTLSVTVGADGSATAAEVATSSGHQALDQAALRAVRKGWKFKPGMAKGKPAPGKVTVVFTFAKGEVSRG